MLGDTLGGRYVLSDLLGSGGMAEVFLARDRMLERDVALKVLREHYAKDEGFVGRFLKEARSAASLNHPGVVQVYDQGRTADGHYFIAMEHAGGGNLKDLIVGRGALDPAEAALIASQVAEALGTAHERGIVHRDIKPQNVLMGEAGEAKVADFGIALAASRGSTSGTDLIFGTPGYMSPEQAMGERVGPQGDLYSLGVVLYEMLTGAVPFEAEGPLATAMKHVTDLPVSPRERDPSVPEAMDALVMALLAKDPEERYPSAWELAEDLRRARAGLPLAFVAGAAGHPEAPQDQAGADGGARSDDPGSEPRSSRKKPVAIGLVALAALLALGTFGWGLTGYREEGPNKGVGAVAASEGGGEGGAPAASDGSRDAREGSSGEGVGSALPAVDLAGGRYATASSSAPTSAPASASTSASAWASASTSASASASPSASAPAAASATPEAQASEPVASGPRTPAPSASASPAAQGGPSGSGGKDAGTTTSTVVVEAAAQEQYR